MNSILTSIKKLLGIDESYTQFDTDVVMWINSTFMTLNQLGVGPIEGFIISDSTKTWTDYLGNSIKLEAVKTYVYFTVKLGFDPPSSSAVLESMKKKIDEFEWRICAQAYVPEPEIIVDVGGDL